MNVLSIDTATDAAAVALWREGTAAVRPLGWRATFTETAPAVAALLEAAGLGWEAVDAVAIPAGPGSFTGLRVGAALALALAEARGAALHAVPTLAAVAEAYAGPGDGEVVADLDARRGRRFAARYAREAGGWRLLEGPLDVAPEALTAWAGEAPVVGPDRPARPGASPPTLAEGVARLVARDPERYRLPAPAALEIVYARPGVDRAP